MILDSSAIVALLLREQGYEVLAQKLASASQVAVGAPTLVETTIVLSARTGRDMRGLVARFLQEANVTVLPFTEAHFSAAVEAWLHFGKGRHAASLNFGDCLSFAVAKVSESPLLCLGDDFVQTGIPLA